MSDVVFLSSVFNEVKIAEPMGVCILTASLREHGFNVDILEPSIEGWSVERTVEEIVAHPAPIVALSMLRDKHVNAVLQFVSMLRSRCPNRFIVIGGHGPSIAVSAIQTTKAMQNSSISSTTSITDTNLVIQIPLVLTQNGVFVDPALVDRGKGAGEVEVTETNLPPNTHEEGNSAYFYSAPDDADSPYFDKSREYLQILSYIDTYMLGESDTNFPILVGRILAGQLWHDIPGLAYLDNKGNLIRNPRPPKIDSLSQLPHMSRDVLIHYQQIYGQNIPASLLTSRGCYYRCTFCSVVQYEQLQEGSRHRQRTNEDLVAEIVYLYRTYGINHFNFEDDNFIVKNRRGIQKLHELCDMILALDFKIHFAFFCRADAVREDLFRHLKEAGLTGIYFGMESVYSGDLEFFHKGTKVDDNYFALDTLLRLGFSLKAGSQARIMLGYITWHPLTTFASLKATSDFIQRYEAPPKLLRRKLRLYAATEIVQQVASLGLINPVHKDGWNFMDHRIEGLDQIIDKFFGTVNKTRDRLRTLEKAHHEYGYVVDTINTVYEKRIALDHMLYKYFDEIVTIAGATDDGAISLEVRHYDDYMRTRLEQSILEQSISSLITEGYASCGFTDNVVDLFRK